MSKFRKFVRSRFDGGYNNSVNPFLIGNDEWAAGQNMIVKAGSEVDVRPGSVKLHETSTSSSAVVGLFRFYKSDGTTY